MKVTETFADVSGIRTAVLRPQAGAWPRLVLYSDIFQLTESTLRSARRFASAGYVVAVPEIYPHGDLAGVALAFDDEGKRLGQAAADATTTAEFDADIATVLTWLAGETGRGLRAVGFCTGGHLALRAALDPRVVATALYYPTGLHDGKLGADRADSLERAGEIRGRLSLTFGLADPHTGADARVQILQSLTSQGVDAEWHVVPGEHAFMRDEGPRYDPALTDLALTAGLQFLARETGG